MTTPAITVVGSVNLDVVATVDTLPSPGATVRATRHFRAPGGKGANQALAARRLGAEVVMVGAVGADANAAEAMTLLAEGGVDLACVRSKDAPTGIALITVSADGENVIVVVGGANELLTVEDLPSLGGDAVICQLEVPIPVVEAAAGRARGLFCLNAAPAVSLPAELLEIPDVVVVNETERDEQGEGLSRRRGLTVVTLGAEGAVAYERGREVARSVPPRVQPVDTVGAGDTFVAALVVSLVERSSLSDALRFACAAGAAATTVAGAQPSLPSRDAVLELLAAG